MCAVVGVLNESLTESIRGFYKLRKAYVTLSGILDAEARYMKKRNGMAIDTPSRTSVESFGSRRSMRSMRSMKRLPGDFDDEINSQPISRPTSIYNYKDSPISVSQMSHVAQTNKSEATTDDEDEFYDADDSLEHIQTATYAGHIETNGMNEKLDGMSNVHGGAANGAALTMPTKVPTNHGLMDHDPESDIFSNPIDVFIHSGANLCFGLLLVMISMIPPAFGKLLLIIGFHGDKDRGIRMLWQASKFHNINGAMAGLIVLGFYNTFVGFSDIIPDLDPNVSNQDNVEGYPKERIEALLADMRSRHPNSQLWLLEEAREKASNRQLSKAIALLEGSPKSPLKQVEAIKMFEKSLEAMYSHDYALCATSFIKCVDMNNWSHALYYYIAGSAYVELYRQRKSSDPKGAEVYARKASEFLKLAPKHAGKKKFMARQLPFDVFVTRKVHKWESRVQEWSVPFIDAVGVSPIEEMIYFWNGYKRMDSSQLQTSLDRLAWSESSNPHWSREGHDERAILAVLRGATIRNLTRWDEAKQILRTSVLSVDPTALKGGLKDDWTAPVAHYEMGVNCWMQRGVDDGHGNGLDVAEKWVRECETWIEKASKWEGYSLDARIGLKITTAQDTIKKWKAKNTRAKA